MKKSYFIPLHQKPLTHPEGLPGAHDAVVQGVDNVEHVRLLETHLTLVRLVVVEVGFDIEGIAALELKMSGDEYMIMRIDSGPYISPYLPGQSGRIPPACTGQSGRSGR